MIAQRLKFSTECGNPDREQLHHLPTHSHLLLTYTLHLLTVLCVVVHHPLVLPQSLLQTLHLMLKNTLHHHTHI